MDDETNIFKVKPRRMSTIISGLCVRLHKNKERFHPDLEYLDQEQKEYFYENRAFSDTLEDALMIYSQSCHISRMEYERYKDNDDFMDSIKEKMFLSIGRALYESGKFTVEQWGDHQSERIIVSVCIMDPDVMSLDSEKEVE